MGYAKLLKKRKKICGHMKVHIIEKKRKKCEHMKAHE